MEVRYWAEYKMVDFIVHLPDNSRMGVSVTRAMTAPGFAYTRDDAIRLLKKKLHGLIVARNAVVEDHSFFQSVLHIWCPSKDVADMLQDVIENKEVDFDELDLVGTLDVWLTITPSTEIFTNQWPD